MLIVKNIWAVEYEGIRRHQDEIGVTYYSEDKSRKKKFPKTTGYKGVTYEDINNFNISFHLENPGPCPVCGGKLQEKDVTRSELICRNPDCKLSEEDENGKLKVLDRFHGGLVIHGTQYGINYPEGKAKMAITAKDIADSQAMKKKGIDISAQDIAWNNFFEK